MAEATTTPEAKPEGGTPQEPPATPGKTFSQEDVDRVVSDRLARERVKHQDYDDLKAKAAELDEIQAANQSEIEKATTKTQKAEQRATEAEAKLLRYEVAAEKKVPGEAVDLLTATSREELEAQADKLLELAKTGEKPPEFDGGAREPAPEAKDPQEAHTEFLKELFAPKQL